ncbi:MAG: manganese efflux pump [Bacilli bacterium]|nr:manganese efflux pump [Bacilli bacterium]MDY6430237.1 manganese efflux pump [Bacilli bacterium]
MTAIIIGQIILLGLGLSADAFSVALTEGLVCTDLNKKRSIFIAAVFGIMQAVMPLIGFWLVEGAEFIAGQVAGAKAGRIAAIVVVWLAFGLLLFVGSKMIIEAISSLRKPPEEKVAKKFSIKEVIFYGFMTAIDALAAGVAMHANLSNTTTVWLHVSIILVITFVISLIGLFLGKQILKLLRGKYEISEIIGGAILVLLAVWVVLSHYTGL